MSAGIARINPVVGSEYGTSLNVTGTKQSFFSGYQPLVLKFAAAGVATLDTQATPTSAIVEGTRTKAIRAIARFGSILMTDDADATTAVTVIVDGATFNRGTGTGGLATQDTLDFSGVKAAVDAATGTSTTLTKGASLNSDGTWALS
jgi:hypothetical protein